MLLKTSKVQPGSKVLINQFGSATRMKLALGWNRSTKSPAAFTNSWM